MKGYKGFDKDLKCRGFQYEVGKTYETDEAKLCEKGFHFCEAPFDVFHYYSAAECGQANRFCEVNADDVSKDRDTDDTKRVAKKLTIGAEIGIPGLVKAQIEYVKSKVKESVEKGDSEAATAGDSGAATAGDSGAATAGDSGAATAGSFGAATAGSFGAATAGSFGAATAGYRGAATAGYRGAATAGDSGAATAGDSGAATSRGSSSSGVNGLSVARGNGVKVRGGLGAVLVIAEEYEDSYDTKEWKAAVVDGEKIKANTWYKLVDGEFKEWDCETAEIS